MENWTNRSGNFAIRCIDCGDILQVKNAHTQHNNRPALWNSFINKLSFRILVANYKRCKDERKSGYLYDGLCPCWRCATKNGNISLIDKLY